jgi:hypothetical protein
MSVVVCAVCNTPFDPKTSVGKWECRTHIARDRERIRGADVYPCCSLSLEDEARASQLFFTFLSPLKLLGCVAADHVLPIGHNNGGANMRRQLDDIHLIIDETNSGVLNQIRRDALPLAPIALTYDTVTLATFTGLGFDLKIAPGVTTVHKDVREQVMTAIEIAYGRDELYARDADLTNQRTQLLNVRKSWPGTMPKFAPQSEREFYVRQGPWSDNEFLRRWFTQIKPNAIKITVGVVQAVSPDQDSGFLSDIQRQRAFVNDC